MVSADTTPPAGRSTRRQFLIGGAAAGIGVAAGAAAGVAAGVAATSADDAPSEPAIHGGDTVPFFGAHQAGIDTDAQAHVLLLGLDLNDNVDRAGLRGLMRLLTDDAARLTQGRAALADTEPELAASPARLTVTFGFGPRFVARAGGESPTWLAPLPAFGIDQLQPEYSDGDLLVQIASDDPLTVAHAARMLLKDARHFTSVRWSQPGFRRAAGTERPGTTMRNLFGQVDGTANPQPGSDDFDAVVWARDGWWAGGTGAVIRRIEMDLEGWDLLDRGGREASVGRTLDTGAPLTGGGEFAEADFDAVNDLGFPVIPVFAHMRRSRSDDPTERIFRRGYNYDTAPAPGAISSSGLLFVSFQADVERQFTPLQRRLDELDLLNQWTTPIGSSVFVIPPGCADGGYIGETLLG